jgi:hypothetical protein
MLEKIDMLEDVKGTRQDVFRRPKKRSSSKDEFKLDQFLLDPILTGKREMTRDLDQV